MSKPDIFSMQGLAPARLLLSQCALVITALLLTPASVFSQGRSARPAREPISQSALLRIVQAEDERRWDKELRSLLSDPNPNVRMRAALATGRIGNEASVAALVGLLRADHDWDVRVMAAFALGEIESGLGADELLATVKNSDPSPLRARAIEALGKIAAALPKEQDVRSRELGGAVLEALRLEGSRRSAPDELTALLALTAVLRAKPANAGPVVGQFARYNDRLLSANASNTLARLKLKDENVFLRKLLTTDPDPVVRANAARVLGATEDKASYDSLLDRALKDSDSRVRVSAIRALVALKNPQAAVALMPRGLPLIVVDSFPGHRTSPTKIAQHPGAGELLEIATALGVLKRGSKDEEALSWLKNILRTTGPAPEVEIAMARVHPASYLDELNKRKVQESILLDWRRASSLAQGLGEMATAPEIAETKQLRARAVDLLRAMLDYGNSGLTINTLVAVHSEYAVPDVLRAFAAFKPGDLAEVLRQHLKESDVVVRASAAELLGELSLDSTNTNALRDALKVALQDKDLNDAALAIIDALAKQKNRNANFAMMPALDSADHLIRRKVVTALKSTGAGDFTSRIGTVQTRNTAADYRRALARFGKTVTAVVATSRGAFTIELMPEDAPLTVDNFVQLARRGYFNGIAFHRVVPNFVIQGGDPRGDGNGGPGHSIRCEINEVPFERGAVGMALSGKDTGGSQWFITHAPQPHLDGGYTVFGRVVAGMNVVDNIARGDVISSVAIKETATRTRARSASRPGF